MNQRAHAVRGIVLAAAAFCALRLPANPPQADGAGDERAPHAPALTKEASPMNEHQSGAWTPGLTKDEKRTLLAIARDTLEWCVKGEGGRFSFERYTLTPRLQGDMATFVTLRIGEQLRGCIGSLAPVEPLCQSVHHNAVNAALKDFRFSPVRANELARIHIDVSMLSPIVDIPSVDEFKLGQQGIILEKGASRSVFLPEVAVEQGWTKEETLSYLSQKAGLSAEAWRKGARFKVFESFVLSE